VNGEEAEPEKRKQNLWGVTLMSQRTEVDLNQMRPQWLVDLVPVLYRDNTFYLIV
jgi:hypothetical protein